MNCRFLLSSVFVLGPVVFANAATQNSPSSYIDGSVQFQIRVTPPDLSRNDVLQTYSANELSGFKTISLMRISIPEDMLAKASSVKAAAGEPDFGANGDIKPFESSSGAVDLAMNDVPVLDQGSYGTCVTFASTGALDALVGQGDYIDQQCSLELDIADPADDTYVNDPLKREFQNELILV